MTVTTSYFFCRTNWDGKWGYVDPNPLFTPRSSVSLHWFKHFTAAWPFQYLIMSMINGHMRLRLEFILCNHHHTLTHKSYGRAEFGFHTSTFHTKIECRYLYPFKQFTVAWPFQCLFKGMINGRTRLQLEFIICNLHHTLIYESWAVRIWVPHFYISHQDCGASFS